jgi:hypothetical protein
VVGAENVSRQKVRLEFVAVMMLMEMIIIPQFLGKFFFQGVCGGNYVSHSQ